MPEFKCSVCEKCLSSKRALQQHQNKQKPCVPSGEKTNHRCTRCLNYFSSKQKLTQHYNRKNKCEIYRNIVVVPTDLEKEIEFNLSKDKMLTEMKAEYIEEVKRVFRMFSNPAIALKKKAVLTKKYKENIKKLEERKTIPENMLSIKTTMDVSDNTLETLFKAYKQTKERLMKSDAIINKLEDEHEHIITSFTSILDSVDNDREQLLNIRKELKKRIDNYKEYTLSK